MNKAAKVLDIPVILTEQQPFKPTVSEIDVTDLTVYKKTKFSMLIDSVKQKLSSLQNINHVYIYGIEAHVCVLQTSLELLRGGYKVYLVVDGISSQRTVDRDVAIERLRSAGAMITISESAVYEILKDAKHQKFKQILPLVKDLASGKAKL